ncbi:MAG: SDR family oxidoreductase [Actinobacteria bacterium]|nr:SDR family oxidoreductase [Actinomycetota bacterium]
MPGDQDHSDSQERVLLITGASSGIGAATARAAVAAGWRVALAARSRDKLEALAAEFGDDHALAITCDVTEYADQQAAVAAAVERFGRLDAAFANAGFGARRGFDAEAVEHLREMVLTNVLGPALTIRAAQEEIVRNRGHFVLTGSIAGVRALPGSVYSATKFAVHGMAEALRLQMNGTGVRTTLIAPGMTETPFFDNGAGEGALEAEDIANAVIYALSQPPHVDVNLVLVRPTTQSI